MTPASRITTRRKLFFFLVTVLISLVLVELASQAVLAIFPRLHDPWAARDSSRFNAQFVRSLEENLRTVKKRKRLYALDRDRFWRLSPGVELEVENTFYEMRDAPMMWDIRTNSLGFRADECPADFDGARILCLGDSCTFGLRVRQNETYASRLRDQLASTAPGRRLHVLNAAVPGYTSFQGRLLLGSLLEEYPADIVTIAYGANDLEKDSMSDAERGELLRKPIGKLGRLLGQSGFARLLQGIFRGESEPPDEGELRDRVSKAEYRANILAMIETAQAAGARVLLLDLVFIGPRFQAILEEIAREKGIPLFNCREVFDRTFERIDRGELYVDELAEWMAFYKSNVKSYRPIYYGEDFYQKRYATEREQKKFIALMADPIHASAIGHRIIADWLATQCTGLLENR